MDHLFSVDWSAFFTPKHSLLEMVLRGSAMYLALFVLLRVMARRLAGTMGVADVLVIVLLADAAQNGMAHEYASVSEGVVLVMTILAWDFLIDWLGYHVPALRPYLQQPTLPLIRDGVVLHRNMRKEMLTRDELLSQLREQGVESPTQVKLAQVESDGHLSVIRKDDAAPHRKPERVPK